MAGPSIFRILCVSSLFTLILAGSAPAQSHSGTTDPEEIAAECGGTAEAGRGIFAVCADCHALTKDAPPMRGPHLEGIAGRKIASVDGFEYSPAMRLVGLSGATWERERLHAYLENPSAHMPGTSMEFSGISNEQDRRDLMTYLRIATLAPPPPPGTLKLEPEVLALQGDLDYGEYLAGECLACHQENKSGQNIPNIYTLNRDAFVYAMHEYRLRSRPNAAMQMVAGVLGDEEIASLAAYFEAQGKAVNN